MCNCLPLSMNNLRASSQLYSELHCFSTTFQLKNPFAGLISGIQDSRTLGNKFYDGLNRIKMKKARPHQNFNCSHPMLSHNLSQSYFSGCLLNPSLPLCLETCGSCKLSPVMALKMETLPFWPPMRTDVGVIPFATQLIFPSSWSRTRS